MCNLGAVIDMLIVKQYDNHTKKAQGGTIMGFFSNLFK